MEKRFSQAADNNKAPILAELQEVFSKVGNVLEIGSGTGQHAAHFAPLLPHLTWQTSDLLDNHPSILAWQQEAACQNLVAPFEFQIGVSEWPASLNIDAVYSANTAHIMQVSETAQMMRQIADNLPQNGVFALYGPFNVDGQYTSDSNQAFDQHLRQQGYGGIRDIQELQRWAGGLALKSTRKMPANNLLLVFRK